MATPRPAPVSIPMAWNENAPTVQRPRTRVGMNSARYVEAMG